MLPRLGRDEPVLCRLLASVGAVAGQPVILQAPPSPVEPLLIPGGGHSEASLEVSVQVALVGEAGGFGGVGDRRARLEQKAGGVDAMSDLQRVWWESGALAEQANEAELSDAGGGGELIESDVAFGLVGEIVDREPESALITCGDRWARGADGR